MLGFSYGEIFLLLGATAALIGPKDLPIISRTAGRLAGRAIGYVQLARGQFENVMQQSQARQVHKELHDTMTQLDAIRHEIRTISIMNPGPLTRSFVDSPDQTSVPKDYRKPEDSGENHLKPTVIKDRIEAEVCIGKNLLCTARGFTRFRRRPTNPRSGLMNFHYPVRPLLTALMTRNRSFYFSNSTYISGTATELIQQAKREQLAPTVYPVYHMLEVNSELKQLVKQGQLCKARDMFEKMDHRDEISWTTLVSGYVNASDSYEALFLFSNMWVQPGLQRDQFMISVALKACALGVNICLGELLHGFSVKSGLINSVFVSSALIDMYMKVGKIEQGCRVFEKMMCKNVVSWTAIISGLVHAGYNMEGLLYFSEMWRSKVGYDSHTFSIALKASADSSLLHHGKAIHTQTIKQGFDESSFVINTLATMYNKCGKPGYVVRLFEKMRMPDVVSWTNLITTYVQMGEEEHAVKVFKRMRKSDVPPNKFTFAAIISACANLAIAKWGEQIHGHVFRLGLVDALSVANSIITLYSKCGLLTSASLVFRGITRKDIISWSTIIAVYSQGGYAKEAFDYLSWMRREGPKPNEFAIASILSVCGSMALLEQGKQVHAHLLCSGIDHEAMVHSALISMYSKCGSVQEASKVFDGLQMNDIISWTAMINGYAEHGYSLEAIDLFEKISSVGLMPDYVTFIGVLTACSHAGMVDLGVFYFLKMTNEYQISPSKEHYGCIIDLLCRAGQLSEAEHMIRTMPFGIDDVVWSTLLRACKEHGDVDRGRWTAEQLLQLDPNSAGTHITLANIYAAKGRWKEVADIRKLMKSKGVIKERGWSWINVNDQLNAFVAGDQAHPQSEHITTILELLRENIGDARLEIRSLHEDVVD